MGTRPSTWQTGTVTGTIQDENFDPYVGSVVLTPSIPSITVKSQAVIPLGPQTFPLTSGTFTATLGATDDTDTTRVDWTYTAKVVDSNGKDDPRFPTWTFPLPQNTTVDLDQLTVDYPASSGRPNLIVGSSGPADWSQLQNRPTVIAAGATQADARSVIGAGTSNLILGSSNTTAKAGDWKPDFTTDVTGKPTTYPPSAHTHQPSDVGASVVGSQLIQSASQDAALTALGASTIGRSVVKAADLPTLQDLLGIAALIAAAITSLRTNDLANTFVNSYESNGTYTITGASTTRPIYYFGQSQPPLRAIDRWASG